MHTLKICQKHADLRDILEGELRGGSLALANASALIRVGRAHGHLSSWKDDEKINTG